MPTSREANQSGATVSDRRSSWGMASLGFAWLLGTLCCETAPLFANDPARSVTSPIAIGGRRELLVDTHLVERMRGVALKLHTPTAADVVIECTEPWEGNTSAYYTLFEDEGRFRMYYRGSHYNETTRMPTHAETACYAESRDGIVWHKPKLGLIEFNGTKENNIVWMGDEAAHNFTPFRDSNPAAAPTARYKALGRNVTPVNGKRKSTLLAFQSPDGVRWSRMRDTPVIVDGAFDSQNLAFWDAQRGEYRAYWRYFGDKIRAIRTATSKDFLNWENQADLRYEDSPSEHLYTNAVMPYFRAPHLFIGFPTRFQPKHQQVEPVFMSSRDGVLFRRWNEALIPITAPQDRDGNRSNYMTSGLLQLPGKPGELSVYATERYYAGPGSRVRRFTYRTDGFVSASTGESVGTLTTKPITFAGEALSVNVVSRGSARAELQTADGQPIPGFTLADCAPITGDHLSHTIAWKGGSLAPLAGKPVRLHWELKEADLYSLQFGPKP